MITEGTTTTITITVAGKPVDVVCTLVEERGRLGWVVEDSDLIRAIEDAAGAQAEEERCHAAE
jgi:hypothetical protein